MICPVTHKTCHNTKQAAHKHIRSAKKRGAPKELYVYKCPDCKHWHLTKSKR